MVLKSIASGSTARIEAQLAVDRLGMPTDRVRAQDQALGDLFVAQSHRQQTQHLDFTCRQRFIRGRRKWRRRPHSEIITIKCEDVHLTPVRRPPPLVSPLPSKFSHAL